MNIADQQSQESDVRQLLTDFVEAFRNLDWAAFRSCWVDDPVVFYPSLVPDETGRRVDALPGFEKAWHRQFERIRKAAAERGQLRSPYHDIQPDDVRVDFVAPTVAVVTFHIGPDSGVLGRRMLVAVSTPNGWKISHLHASNLSLPNPTTA